MRAHLHLAPAASDGRAAQIASAIRVVLADDHTAMRRSLRMVLEHEPNIEVVAEAHDLASVVRGVEDCQPDVLVLDLTMPDGSSVQAIGEIRERAPATQIVVLTMDDSPACAQSSLGAGALGYVLKELADGELPDAIRAAVRGEQYISPSLGVRLGELDSSLAEDRLTPREVEVLRLIALGHTSVEIARKLQLSPRTIETHRAHILSKLGMATRAQLVRYALSRGLLKA
ncbi:MAG TPA: response regulator transcription factor [Solirubrobacteraceae bacterium]|nr:response regulator transcription factor [Solirubrobacteraceae bacterium]